MRDRYHSVLKLAIMMTCLLWSALGWAQQYPSKPITIVVAYPAGGDTDALARLFAEKLSKRIGTPVMIDNRPGATGTIGSSYVSRAPADGYTLLLAPSALSTAQLVLKTGKGATYDVLNGFTPIIETNVLPVFLVAAQNANIKSFKEALALARTRSLSFASPGIGSSLHLVGEMVNRAAGVNINHVPYKGVAPAVNDVLGGHIPLTYMTLGPVAAYIPSGRLLPLAVADRQRSPLAPGVPTMLELGYKDIEVVAWHGLFGPRGLPADVVKLLNAQFNEIIRMPDVVANMATLGALPLGGPPETLAKTNARDLERFGHVIKELNIQAE